LWVGGGVRRAGRPPDHDSEDRYLAQRSPPRVGPVPGAAARIPRRYGDIIGRTVTPVYAVPPGSA